MKQEELKMRIVGQENQVVVIKNLKE